MQLRVAFADRHFPLRGRRLLQHRPGCRAATPHRFIPVPHAARTVSVLVTETHFITRRLLHFDVAQSASSSSATTMVRLVRTPWPISERLHTTVTVPSAAMLT
jgi:hypothetical protein